MPVEAAKQLARHGIDAITARDAGKLSDDDLEQLRFATDEGRVLCSYDKDFIEMAKDNIEHAGIVYVRGGTRSVGVLVKALREIHRHETADGMKNRLEYL